MQLSRRERHYLIRRRNNFMEKKPFISYSEAAEILGIKMTTLYSYIWARKLVPIKRPGWKSVFNRDYIMAIANGTSWEEENEKVKK